MARSTSTVNLWAIAACKSLAPCPGEPTIKQKHSGPAPWQTKPANIVKLNSGLFCEAAFNPASEACLVASISSESEHSYFPMRLCRMPLIGQNHPGISRFKSDAVDLDLLHEAGRLHSTLPHRCKKNIIEWRQLEWLSLRHMGPPEDAVEQARSLAEPMFCTKWNASESQSETRKSADKNHFWMKSWWKKTDVSGIQRLNFYMSILSLATSKAKITTRRTCMGLSSRSSSVDLSRHFDGECASFRNLALFVSNNPSECLFAQHVPNRHHNQRSSKQLRWQLCYSMMTAYSWLCLGPIFYHYVKCKDKWFLPFFCWVLI